MNNAYLDKAKKMVPDPRILTILASKRSKQLALGARPTVKCNSENCLDVALLEIAEGKIVPVVGDEPEAVEAVTAGSAVTDVSDAPSAQN